MKARTRLFKEFKEAQRDATAEADFQLLADDTNIYTWTAFLKVRRHVVWINRGGRRGCREG
jgi:ubiquitin-protein ligase